MMLSNSILYPNEDKEQKILLYACRNCDHREVADNNCVYRNEIHHSVGERTQVWQDVAADPTLPRTKSVRCTQCNDGGAIFFQVKSLFNLHTIAGRIIHLVRTRMLTPPLLDKQY